MLFILFSIQCVLSITDFNLDESPTVLLPVGGTVVLHKRAEIIKAQTWVAEDPNIFRLKIKTVTPKKESSNPMALPKFSAIEVSCTRDCKVGEEFKVKLNLKDLIKGEIKETTEITIRVISPNEDL